jgi:large subunit ribosomal protein L11
MVSTIKIFVPAVEAKPGPPLAPILGQHQVNLIEFCKEFNKISIEWTNGVPLAIKVIKNELNKFSIVLRAPNSKFFLEQITLDLDGKLDCSKLYDIILVRSKVSKLDIKSVAKMYMGFLNSKKINFITI